MSVLGERQLAGPDSAGAILGAVVAWREEIVVLLSAALGESDLDLEALADHVFATFEGAFILCRTTGDPGHMGRQLAAFRVLVEALVAQAAPRPARPRIARSAAQ